MPIYEYQCEQCGHQLESFQKISDAPLVDCPECGRAELRKLVSPTSFRLKGTGWYVTDFKDKGKQKKVDSEAPAKKASPDKKEGESSQKSDSSSESAGTHKGKSTSGSSTEND